MVMKRGFRTITKLLPPSFTALSFLLSSDGVFPFGVTMWKGLLAACVMYYVAQAIKPLYGIIMAVIKINKDNTNE